MLLLLRRVLRSTHHFSMRISYILVLLRPWCKCLVHDTTSTAFSKYQVSTTYAARDEITRSEWRPTNARERTCFNPKQSTAVVANGYQVRITFTTCVRGCMNTSTSIKYSVSGSLYFGRCGLLIHHDVAAEDDL